MTDFTSFLRLWIFVAIVAATACSGPATEPGPDASGDGDAMLGPDATPGDGDSGIDAPLGSDARSIDAAPLATCASLGAFCIGTYACENAHDCICQDTQVHSDTGIAVACDGGVAPDKRPIPTCTSFGTSCAGPRRHCAAGLYCECWPEGHSGYLACVP